MEEEKRKHTTLPAQITILHSSEKVFVKYHPIGRGSWCFAGQCSCLVNSQCLARNGLSFQKFTEKSLKFLSNAYCGKGYTFQSQRRVALVTLAPGPREMISSPGRIVTLIAGAKTVVRYYVQLQISAPALIVIQRLYVFFLRWVLLWIVDSEAAR